MTCNGYCARWLRAIEVRVIYWLGTRAEMLRAFRFDSSVHMRREASLLSVGCALPYRGAHSLYMTACVFVRTECVNYSVNA